MVTNDFRASMALTAAWFALSGAACVAIAVRRRALRIPVLATYVVVVGAVGGFLALTTLRDRALKGNRGDQQYRLPANVPVRGHSVVIWCRAFGASFGAAQLRGRASPG